MSLSIATQPEEVIDQAPACHTPITWWKTALNLAAGFVITAIILWIAIPKGLEARRWYWDNTFDSHYLPDMENRWTWATFASNVGLYNTYDIIDLAARSDGYHQGPDYGLDYAPLRLMLMSRWAQWVQAKYPSADARDTRYVVSEPLLQFNYYIELFGALGIFLLVRNWMRQCYQQDLYPPRSRIRRWMDRLLKRHTQPDLLPPAHHGPMDFFYGWWHGLIAAMIFWFNPAIIASAHGWPTWDMWVIPFFIWAVYFAQTRHWFLSGILLGIGALMKGQLLFVVPMFILWPLLQLRLRSMFAWLGGMAVSLSIIVAPWMLTWQPGLEGKLRGRDLNSIRNSVSFTKTLAGDRLLNTDAIHWIIGLAVAALLANLAWMCLRRRPAKTAMASSTTGKSVSPNHIVNSSTGAANIPMATILPDGVSPAAAPADSDPVFSVLARTWRPAAMALLILATFVTLRITIHSQGQNPSGKPMTAVITDGVNDLIKDLSSPKSPRPGSQYNRSLRAPQPAKPPVQFTSDQVIFWTPILLTLALTLSAGVIWLARNRVDIPWLNRRCDSDRRAISISSRLTRSLLGEIPPRLVMILSVAGLAALSTIYLQSASNAWASIGWFFGLRHYPNMITGTPDNLAAILVRYFGWMNPEVPVRSLVNYRWLIWTAQGNVPTIGEVLKMITIILLIISCIGVSLQHKRKDPRFLVAVCTPWMIFFAFPAQVHERYLIFCAASAAIWVGLSWGMTLLGIGLTILTYLMTMQIMLGTSMRQGPGTSFGSEFSPDMANWLNNLAERLHPNAGFAIIAISLIMLWMCFAPSKRLRHNTLTTAGPQNH